MAIDPQIWLNKVRAVPAIGLRLNPSFEAAATLLERIRPLLTRWAKSYGTCEVSIQKDGFVLKVERPDGYELTFNHEAMSCKFYYVSSFVEKGLRQPAVTYQTDARPIEELTVGAAEIVSAVSEELWKAGNRSLRRIGVVATGTVDRDAMPPGFDLFVKHLGRPWSKGIGSFSANLTAMLNESKGEFDQCRHNIAWSEGDESANFHLDWQRHFVEGKSLPFSKLKDETEKSIDTAFRYFGEFGIGELDYADS